ncbi:MAG: DUF1844 domain-containing protein [Candidatus Omnitrophica bacterium]|nr:DUF1844 domain-containing protein [Candidatus Omnitrophota bacterium]
MSDKRVDESWKARVEKERQGPERPSPATPPEEEKGGFPLFLSSLSMQALVALGELPHPATRAPQKDLEQARTLIDVLGMLQEKTRGNLTAEESRLLEDLLYELRMKYVEKTR